MFIVSESPAGLALELAAPVSGTVGQDANRLKEARAGGYDRARPIRERSSSAIFFRTLITRTPPCRLATPAGSANFRRSLPVAITYHCPERLAQAPYYC